MLFVFYDVLKCGQLTLSSCNAEQDPIFSFVGEKYASKQASPSPTTKVSTPKERGEYCTDIKICVLVDCGVILEILITKRS